MLEVAMKDDFAVDFGFSFIKSMYRKEKLKEPSFFAFHLKEKNLTSSFGMQEPAIYDFNGTPYIVGKEAEFSEMKIFRRDISFILEFYPLAVAHAMKKHNIKEFRNLLVGLPPEDLNEANAKMLKDNIVKAKINNNKIPVSKSNIKIFSQGQGAFIDYKSSNGNLRETGFLIDIGFNTLIAIPFKNGKISPSYQQYNKFGISGLLNNFLSPLIQNRFNKKLNIHQLNNAFLKEELSLGIGKKESIKEEVRKAVELYLQIVLQTLQEDFSEEILDIQKFVISGGGAYRIINYIPDSLKDIVHINEEPDFSNVRGYKIIGQLQNRG